MEFPYLETYLAENPDSVLEVRCTKHGFEGKVMTVGVEMAADCCDELDSLLRSLSDQLEDD